MFANVHSMCVGERGILRGQNRVLNLPLELGSQAVVCSRPTQVPKPTGVLCQSSKGSKPLSHLSSRHIVVFKCLT